MFACFLQDSELVIVILNIEKDGKGEEDEAVKEEKQDKRGEGVVGQLKLRRWREKRGTTGARKR